jgi:hypothetical protein
MSQKQIKETSSLVKIKVTAVLDKYGKVSSIQGGHNAKKMGDVMDVLSEYMAGVLSAAAAKQHPADQKAGHILISDFLTAFEDCTQETAQELLTKRYALDADTGKELEPTGDTGKLVLCPKDVN